MFITLQVLRRRGASDPLEGPFPEVWRIDLIHSMREVEEPTWDEPCTEITLEDDQLICQGSLHEYMEHIDEAFK